MAYVAQVPERPALHGLIDQIPRQWKSDLQRAQWLGAFVATLDYTIKPPPTDEPVELVDEP